jgi:mono/diheme cytochrome c family protein
MMASSCGTEAALHATRILEAWQRSPGYHLGDTAFDEERRDVLAGVMEAMQSPEPDADRDAACCYLLRHLAASASRS